MGSDTMPAVGPLNPTTITDRIESSQENRQTVAQPLTSALDYNPQQREPLTAGQIYKSAQQSSPPLTREKTAPAIGPATDKPTPVPKESEIEGPLLYITLLLSSTGARHPYKLDEKYLKKRNVTVEGNNPINLSLYKLKELILRDWREGETVHCPSDQIRLDLSLEVLLMWNLLIKNGKRSLRAQSRYA